MNSRGGAKTNIRPMKSSARRNSSSGSPILVISIGLICVAVTMCFTTLGLGFMNIAPGRVPALQQPAAPPQEIAPEPVTLPLQAEPTDRQKKELESMTAKLEQEARDVDQQKRKLALDRATLLKSRNSLAAIEKQLEDGVRQASERANTVKGQAEQQRGSGTANVDARLAEDRRQSAEADHKADELRREIREKKTLFDPDRLFAGRDPGEKPQWVECVKGAVILLPQGERIPIEGLKTAPVFAQAMPGRFVVFLVRPDGFAAFASARAAAEENGAKRLGYEPIDRNWQLKYR